MSINSCQKGKVGEREIVAILKKYGHLARRGQQNKRAPDAPDVIVDDLPALEVEVKWRESVEPISKSFWYMQQQADPWSIPILLAKSTTPNLVIMAAETFVSILKPTSLYTLNPPAPSEDIVDLSPYTVGLWGHSRSILAGWVDHPAIAVFFRSNGFPWAVALPLEIGYTVLDLGADTEDLLGEFICRAPELTRRVRSQSLEPSRNLQFPIKNP